MNIFYPFIYNPKIIDREPEPLYIELDAPVTQEISEDDIKKLLL